MRSRSVLQLPKVGAAVGKKLDRLGIQTYLDLLLHVPFRYEDRTHFLPLGVCKPGTECYVQGMITRGERLRGRRGFTVEFRDQSGSAKLRIVNEYPGQFNRYRQGDWLRVFGEMSQGRQFIHAEHETFTYEPNVPEPSYAPVYRTTKGLSRKFLGQLIAQARGEISFLPEHAIRGMTVRDALQILHDPDPALELQDVREAQIRLALDEMLAYALVTQTRRSQPRTDAAIALPKQSESMHTMFLDQLDFELTSAQSRVCEEIFIDLEHPVAMRRLLQGDVGSGKTVVAVLAAVRAAENGVQTAIMAPTELLAEQHYETFSALLDPLGIGVTLLTGQLSSVQQKARQEAIRNGDVLVAIGTHALFQAKTRFHRLGLTITDEQHRFGVHQRMELKNKGSDPHQLIMTATPIPRTLAHTMFADLDVSVIDELPSGRPSISTTMHSKSRRAEVIRGVYLQAKSGRQIFWVCAAIEENDATTLEATSKVAIELDQQMPEITVSECHGQMPTEIKNQRMNDFREGITDLLVATTVIEVGIDIPNASIMVIENAEHLGLSQLHQLRGRIGRGTVDSHCLLIYDDNAAANAMERLKSMRQTTDGFELAKTDYLIRGQGQLFGTQQSGTEQFRFATTEIFLAHSDWVVAEASRLVGESPELSQSIINTWASADHGYVAV